MKKLLAITVALVSVSNAGMRLGIEGVLKNRLTNLNNKLFKATQATNQQFNKNKKTYIEVIQQSLDEYRNIKNLLKATENKKYFLENKTNLVTTEKNINELLKKASDPEIRCTPIGLLKSLDTTNQTKKKSERKNSNSETAIKSTTGLDRSEESIVVGEELERMSKVSQGNLRKYSEKSGEKKRFSRTQPDTKFAIPLTKIPSYPHLLRRVFISNIQTMEEEYQRYKREQEKNDQPIDVMAIVKETHTPQNCNAIVRYAHMTENPFDVKTLEELINLSHNQNLDAFQELGNKNPEIQELITNAANNALIDYSLICLDRVSEIRTSVFGKPIAVYRLRPENLEKAIGYMSDKEELKKDFLSKIQESANKKLQHLTRG